MTRRLHGGRIAAFLLAVGACVSVVVAGNSSWVKTTSPFGLTAGNNSVVGLSVSLNRAGGLDHETAQAVMALALVIGIAAIVTLVPYLRFVAVGVIVAGGLTAGVGIAELSQINEPAGSGVFDRLRHAVVQQSPGVGVYLMIIGGALAVMSGLVTLLTPRTTAVAQATPTRT